MQTQPEISEEDTFNLPSIIAKKYFRLLVIQQRHRALVKPYLYRVLYGVTEFGVLTKEQIIDKTIELMKQGAVR